ncbi:MAG: histidine kinase [Gammaproteobacteria bacterium]|nr:histidine kinase [Gammaproteobacteria bacterium]
MDDIREDSLDTVSANTTFAAGRELDPAGSRRTESLVSRDSFARCKNANGVGGDDKIVVSHADVKPVVFRLWFMQLLFWASVSAITFFSLTLWYGTGEMPHVLHTLLQSVLGLILTLPMHLIYRYLWQLNAYVLVIGSAIVVIAFSLAWSWLRVATFIAMTAEGPELWDDFGGWYFSAFFIFLCWTALYYNLMYYTLASRERDRRMRQVEHARQEKLKRFRAEKLASEARLEMLRYQLNPHFLFNALNAINALVAIKESSRAREMIDKLSGFLRYALKDEGGRPISLRAEIEALELYMTIEKTRFPDRLHVKYDLDDDALNARVPSLILQPLVENAIKYAIAASENGGTINVSAHRKDNNLWLAVEDDGPGIEEIGGGVFKKDEFQFGGVGIRNIHDRLEALYSRDYQMNLHNRPGEGLKIELVFPFDRLHQV